MREAWVRIVLQIINNLAVPVLLGSSLIDKFVQEIFPTYREIVSYNAPLVPILIVHQASVDDQTTT